MRQFLKLSFIFIITLILYGCNQNIKEINVKYFVEGDLHFEVIITDEFILADEPVKEGYIFNGWYFDEDFNEELKLDEISLLDEINLYANFIPSNNTKYVVNYYLENIEDDEYTLLETESMEGTTNVVVGAVVREYDGFNFDLEKSNVEGVIKADESLVLNLYYQRDLFSVTFDSSGGDSVNKIDNIKFGSKIDLVNTEKAGFNFLGWFLDDRMFDFDEKITQNLTLVAKWQEIEDKTYLVTFDSDGGSHVEEITVVKGAKIDKPTDLVREGYTFTGWKLNGAHYNFNSSVSENITLKASWRADVYYQVDFNTFGGSLIASVLVKENEKLEKPLDPTKEGYIFMYWHLDYLVFDFNTPITSNLTLEALWDYEIPHYTMSYMTDGGNKIEPFYLEEGSLIPKPDTPVKEGYTFVKWIYARPEMFAGFEVNFSEDTIIGDTIIKAVWVEDEKPKMQMLSFGLNGGKWDDEHVVGAKISYPYSGDIIEFPDDPYRVGYEFLGWYIDDEPFNYEVMPNHSLYILAKWEVNSYEINYTILNEANHLEYKTLLYEDEYFIKISRGQNVTMALTNKNRLLAAGYRTSFHLNGEIGTANISEDITLSFPLINGEKIVNVVGDEETFMLLTSLNRVFTWGSNGSNGQLGSGETNFIVDSPYNITKNFNLLADEKITNVFMGNKKGAAITSLNRVFVWGYNVKNSISNQENLSLLLPVDVTNDFHYFVGEYITDISLGTYHSLYLTNLGRVFERGDLKHYSEDYPGGNNTTIIDRTQEFNLSYGEFITNVYSNSFTSFVLTNEGSLFGWGYNTGNLLLNEYSQEYPIYHSINKISDKITILEENEYIEKFSLSRSTAGIITNEGRVIMWGLANRGVLGKIIANDEHKNEPRAPGVVAVSNINELILTSNSAIALTNLGELSVWGAHSESLGVGSDYLITGPDTEVGLLVTKINFKRANDNFNELIAYGSDLELIIPTKEGYLFDGWYRDNMFKEELTNQTMPAYNINLYGRWIEE